MDIHYRQPSRTYSKNRRNYPSDIFSQINLVTGLQHFCPVDILDQAYHMVGLQRAIRKEWKAAYKPCTAET